MATPDKRDKSIEAARKSPTPNLMPSIANTDRASSPKGTKREADAQVYRRHAKIPRISEIDRFVTIHFESGSHKLPADLLAQHSGYFRKALNSAFAERDTLEFRLSEFANDNNMSVIVEWIYGRSYLEGRTLMAKIADILGDSFFSARLWYTMWLLADYLHMPELQNDMMCGLYERRDFYASTEKFGSFSEKMRGQLPVGSQLFRFHSFIEAARIVNGQHEPDVETHLASLDKDMVVTTASFLSRHGKPFLEQWAESDFMVEIKREHCSQ